MKVSHNWNCPVLPRMRNDILLYIANLDFDDLTVAALTALALPIRLKGYL